MEPQHNIFEVSILNLQSIRIKGQALGTVYDIRQDQNKRE